MSDEDSAPGGDSNTSADDAQAVPESQQPAETAQAADLEQADKTDVEFLPTTLTYPLAAPERAVSDVSATPTTSDDVPPSGTPYSPFLEGGSNPYTREGSGGPDWSSPGTTTRDTDIGSLWHGMDTTQMLASNGPLPTGSSGTIANIAPSTPQFVSERDGFYSNEPEMRLSIAGLAPVDDHRDATIDGKAGQFTVYEVTRADGNVWQVYKNDTVLGQNLFVVLQQPPNQNTHQAPQAAPATNPVSPSATPQTAGVAAGKPIEIVPSQLGSSPTPGPLPIPYSLPRSVPAAPWPHSAQTSWQNQSFSQEQLNKRSSPIDRAVDAVNSSNAAILESIRQHGLGPTPSFNVNQWLADVGKALQRHEVERQINAGLRVGRDFEAKQQAEEAATQRDLPGTLGSITPIYGSVKSLIVHAEHGNYGRAGLYGLLAISDIFLVKALVVGAGRLAVRGAVGILGATATLERPIAQSFVRGEMAGGALLAPEAITPVEVLADGTVIPAAQQAPLIPPWLGYQRGSDLAKVSEKLVLGRYPGNVRYVAATPGTFTVDRVWGWNLPYNMAAVQGVLDARGVVVFTSLDLRGTFAIEAEQVFEAGVMPILILP